MKTLSFRAFHDTENNSFNICSRESSSRPLLVNCAGSFETDVAFDTNNPTGRDDYYLMLIIDGELNFGTQEKPLIYKKGSLILFEAHKPYHYTHKNGESVNYLWVHFTGSYVNESLRECGILPFPSVVSVAIDKRLIMRYQNLFDAFGSVNSLREREISVLFDRLLLSIAKRINNYEDRPRTKVAKTINYINSNYTEKIKIPDLAKMEGISISRYNTVFKETVGITPIEYVTKLRLSAAMEYLSETDMSVTEIAYAVGYSSFHFFTKSFKELVGISPTEFRNGKHKR